MRPTWLDMSHTDSVMTLQSPRSSARPERHEVVRMHQLLVVPMLLRLEVMVMVVAAVMVETVEMVRGSAGRETGKEVAAPGAGGQ